MVSFMSLYKVAFRMSLLIVPILVCAIVCKGTRNKDKENDNGKCFFFQNQLV